MELFKLFGTIAINNQDANAGIDETTGIAENAKSKISGAFEKVGNAAVKVGKTVATGMAAAGAAVVALVKQSVDAYADYEQLVGGVETLFKESADQVLQYANQAFQTAGLSANEYMETVTSFSASLLQSLGGDTAKAAEKADMAITDMADNANKMGTSISAIQVAYQGFAKQNYSMLDNLKLGYGGTAAEMFRLLQDAAALNDEFAKTAEFSLDSKGHLTAGYSDIVDAIHIVQTEMGITGTTAKEAASTISGSISMMKSSWKNLITAMADENADFSLYVNNFVDSVGTVAENLIPRIEIALEGVVGLVDQLAPVIIKKIPPLFSKLLPSVISAATGIMKSLISALPDLISSLSAELPAMIENLIVELLPAFIDAAFALGDLLISELPALVDYIFSDLPLIIGLTLRDSENEFISGIGDMFVTLGNTWNAILKPAIGGLLDAFGSLWDAVQPILSVFGDLFEEMTGVSSGADVLRGLIILIGDALQFVADKVQVVADWISEHSAEIEETIRYLWQGVQDVWETVGKPVFDFIMDLVGSVANIFAQKMPEIKEFVSQCFSDIKSFWENNLKPCFSAIMTFVEEVLAPVFETTLTGAVDTAFNHIKSIWENVLKPTLTGITDFLTGVFTGDVDLAMQGIVKAIVAAANLAIQTAETMINMAIAAINGLLDGVNAVASELGLGEIKLVQEVSLEKMDVAQELIKSGFSGDRRGFGGSLSNRSAEGSSSGSSSGSALGITNGLITALAPKMATGGVLKRGQVGLLEGSGAEAVVPLERNKAWISRVAQDMSTSLGGSETNDLLARLLAAIESMDESMTDKFTDALQAMRFDVSGREFGRLVREYA